MKIKKSRIMEEGMETARDLYDAGAISIERFREYEALYNQTPQFSGEDVRELREKVKLSLAAFANLLNTKETLVREWESGDKKPGRQSCKLLDILNRKGVEALL